MSVRDLEKCLIVSDCLTGQIIDTIELDNLYCHCTIGEMLRDLIGEYVFHQEHGLMIKVGSKSL